MGLNVMKISRIRGKYMVSVWCLETLYVKEEKPVVNVESGAVRVDLLRLHVHWLCIRQPWFLQI